MLHGALANIQCSSNGAVAPLSFSLCLPAWEAGHDCMDAAHTLLLSSSVPGLSVWAPVDVAGQGIASRLRICKEEVQSQTCSGTILCQGLLQMGRCPCLGEAFGFIKAARCWSCHAWGSSA